MKNAIKKAISVLLVAVMVFGTAPLAGFVGFDLPEINLFNTKAEAATYSGKCGENLTWTLDTETGELVISGTGAMYEWDYATATVPWSYYRSDIRTVVLPQGLTSIGYDAFFRCTSLESITIPDSVTSIGTRAFDDCTSLASVTIPDSVTSIGGFAFMRTTQIICNKESYTHSYAVENNLPFFLLDGSEDENTISGKIGIKLTWSIDRKTRKLTVENAGTMDSFPSKTAPWIKYYQYIHSAEIKYGCLNIGENAFYGCRYLKAVEIPFSVTSIGDYAFDGCDSLTSVEIPDGVTSIGKYAFYKCTKLESVTIPDSVTGIGSSVFYDCDSLESIKIPDGVTSIGSSAFYDCDSLESIKIPDGVTSIGGFAFAYCESLTNIEIPDSVTSIGNSAFTGTEYYNNSNNWDNDVLYIGKHLIKAKDTISGSYEIKDGTLAIADYAFEECTILSSVTIPDGITRIGERTFCDCTSLESVRIPAGVKSIDYSAFWNCVTIKDVYYGGSRLGWIKIQIYNGNDCLKSANIHYNSNGSDSGSTDTPDNTPEYDASVVDTYLMPTPTQTTISYGDSIVLHIDPAKIPEGGYVEWYPSNGNFGYSVSSDGTTCIITPEKKCDTTFTVIVYDAEGNIVSADTQTMTSKAGFFDKIIALFKKLFGLTKTIPEAIKVVY